MKKYLSILVLVVLVTPQVAMAAWWNPFSWSVFQKKEASVQQFESRIKDLEQKLEETSGKKVASTTTASPVKVEKPVVKKAEKAVVPVSVAKEVVPEVPKTFVLPSGAVVDGAGNVVSGAPEQITQPSSAQSDKFAGENYFKEHKTCAGLKEVNADQHSFCVSYALNVLNSQSDSRQQIEAAQAQLKALQELKTINDAYLAKKEKLNAINLEMANLNAKYVQDIKDVDTNNAGRGVTTFTSDTQKAAITRKYTVDYSTLQAEYQQIQYGN